MPTDVSTVSELQNEKGYTMSAVHCRVTPSNLLHFKCCLFIAILAGATHVHQKIRLLQHNEFVSLWDFGNCCLKLGFQPARNPGRISDQPGRDFSQPGTNCSQPGCNASLLGRTLGVGPGCTSCILAFMHMTLGSSHLASYTLPGFWAFLGFSCPSLGLLGPLELLGSGFLV